MTSIRKSIHDIYACTAIMELELYKEELKNESERSVKEEIIKITV